MEYVQGETLAVRLAALRAYTSGSGPQGLPFGDMMRYASRSQTRSAPRIVTVSSTAT